MNGSLASIYRPKDKRGDADDEYAGDPEVKSEIKVLEGKLVDASFVGWDLLGEKEQDVCGDGEGYDDQDDRGDPLAEKQSEHAQKQKWIGKPRKLIVQWSEPANREDPKARHDLLTVDAGEDQRGAEAREGVESQADAEGGDPRPGRVGESVCCGGARSAGEN